MRLGPGLLYEGRTLQGARAKLAGFCSAPMAEFYSAVDTREFRAQAVRVALTSGLPRKQVAADFGVGFSTLSRWIQQDWRNPEKPTAQSDLEREIAELRKEHRMLREEREGIKKATQCFAARSAGGSLSSQRTLTCLLLNGCVRSWMSAHEDTAPIEIGR